LDAGSYRGEAFSQEKIPTVEQLLARYVNKPGFELYLELKSGSLHYPGLEAQVVELYMALSEEQRTRVQISSFDHQALLKIKKLCPSARIGLSLDSNILDPVQTAQAVGAESLNIKWDWISPAFVALAHMADLKVIAWTVNTQDVVQVLEAMDVDAIMTDYPERWVE